MRNDSIRKLERLIRGEGEERILVTFRINRRVHRALRILSILDIRPMGTVLTDAIARAVRDKSENDKELADLFLRMMHKAK